jgi:HPt (histidine-containing phosphotransfer) domain-containing protein
VRAEHCQHANRNEDSLHLLSPPENVIPMLEGRAQTERVTTAVADNETAVAWISDWRRKLASIALAHNNKTMAGAAGLDVRYAHNGTTRFAETRNDP